MATNNPKPAAPDNAPAARLLATIPIHVRWRDLDASNHVNNSSYLTYLEEARVQWFHSVLPGVSRERATPVLAAIDLHYRRSVIWPAEIEVQLTCERLGGSSLTIGNRIVSRDDAACVYADGNAVMVWVDPANGKSVSLPQAIRDACKGDGGN